MKNKICILAIDDGPHQKEDLARYKLDRQPTKKAGLVGVVCKGLQLIHVIQTKIDVDGIDSTQAVFDLIESNPFKSEIRMIMINSPTLGGFNPPDSVAIYERFKVPVVLIPERLPKENIRDVFARIFPERIAQIQWLEKLPPLDTLEIEVQSEPKVTREICFHAIGTTKQAIGGVLRYLCEYSSVPEPLRLAHLIASSQIIKH